MTNREFHDFRDRIEAIPHEKGDYEFRVTIRDEDGKMRGTTVMFASHHDQAVARCEAIGLPGFSVHPN